MTATNINDAVALIAAQKPFTAGGKAYGNEANFRGTPVAQKSDLGFGWLGGTSGRFDRGYADSVESATYVVWSYGTPIAWCVPGIGWIVPETKYSVSTTRHQTSVRRAMR